MFTKGDNGINTIVEMMNVTYKMYRNTFTFFLRYFKATINSALKNFGKLENFKKILKKEKRILKKF